MVSDFGSGPFALLSVSIFGFQQQTVNSKQ